ncbi:MAG: hypothetical protein ABEJ57_05795 [Halobacteriaceae archaeon]
MTEKTDIPGRVAALEDAIEAMREDLDRPRRGPRGGLWTLAREVAVPVGLVAVEAQLRVLERLLEDGDTPERGTQSSLGEWTGGRRNREALERVEQALDRLERELERSPVPGGAEASTLLAETRSLRTAIEHELRASGAERDQGVRIEVESGSIDADEGEPTGEEDSP